MLWETLAQMDWLQVGAFVIAVFGLGLAGIVYFTRQLNRQFDAIGDRFDRVDARMTRLEERMTRLEERMGSMEQWQARADERFDRLEQNQSEVRGDVKTLNENVKNLEKEQARMLGFLEGRGVMGKAPPEPEGAT